VIGGAVILVTEDSDEDFDTVREALAETGLPHLLVRATTGDQCLALLRDRDNPLRPVLVLLDLNTPGTGGREVLTSIRSDDSLRALPIVVCSTSTNPRDLQHCYRAGVNAYHVKPTRYIEHRAVLVSIMKYWLETVSLPEAL
jgi:CheY-like chemotaxis protein